MSMMRNNLVLLPNEHGNIQSSYDYFLKFNIPKHKSILDIGCGYGSLVYNLSKRGYDKIQGIDINKERIKKGIIAHGDFPMSIRFYEGYKIPFKDESFDVVLMFDVIEHILNIQDFLKKEAYRVLKKGGLFLFQTPNKYINIPWEILQRRSLTEWKTYHFSLQTRKSLIKILKKAGFENISIEKNNILTEHNKNKVKEKLSCVGIPALYLLQKMPLALYPNFWGCCTR